MKQRNQAGQSFLRGSLLLTGSAAAAKLLGALFRIPLTAQLGGTGMGYFSNAYGLFLPLYAVLVTGLSTAVARPAAAFIGQGNPQAARRVLTVARRLAWAAGLAGTAAAAGLAVPFLRGTGSPTEALPAVLVIAPAVLLCCLTAAERGYYEGLCNMTPTALSQLAEALAKLVCGLCLAGLWMRRPPGFLAGCSPEAAGACGAVLGVTLSTLAGWLVLLRPVRQPVQTDAAVPSDRALLRMILAVLIPAAIGALMTNLTTLIDLVTMQRSFTRMLAADAADFYRKAALSRTVPSGEAAAFVYGSFMGLAVTVFNLVPSLTNMLGKAVLPCTAQAWAAGDRRRAADYAGQVLTLTGLAAVPAGCGLFVLAEGALRFLFAGREAEIRAAAESLRYLAPGLVCLCMAFPVFSLLQAAGRADLPVKILLPGAAAKLLGNLLLLPRLCAAGAALSTSLCYAVILVLSLLALRHVLGERLRIGQIIASELYGGMLCAAAAWLCYTRTLFLLPQRAAFAAAVLCGAGMYALTLALTAQHPCKAFFLRP